LYAICKHGKRDKMKALLVLIIIIISLSFISLAEAANWVYYRTDNELNKLYYEAESITYPAKTIVRVWGKTIFSEAGRKSLEKDIGTKASDIAEDRELFEFNCITREFRIINLTAYNSSGGVVSDASDKMRDWKAILPESIVESLYKEICKKDKP
jgi:predicted S18 family serine protease